MPDPIPEAWPPAEPSEPSVVLPMFPLPGVFLFPQQIMPLHIFEPRYRQMIEDSLDGPGRIVMATVREGQTPELDRPEVLPVAGLGEIVRHVKMPDGRFHILLFGVQRVYLDEVPSEREYRRAACEPVEEIAVPGAQEDELRELLEKAVLARSSDILNLPDDASTGFLADLLSQRLGLSQSELEPIFSEYHLARRARMALEAHERTAESD
ncbi:MAG: LON peptidase substrate-binding domain-containing protein [bacterium]|nr:LON peptidase substrate-binding domain-containing protein [bacterium]